MCINIWLDYGPHKLNEWNPFLLAGCCFHGSHIMMVQRPSMNFKHQTLILPNSQVRKWKMLSRHHNENSSRQKEEEPDVHLGGCQCWGLHNSPLLASPIILECSICSGPYISYALEDTWQPRQRTQVGSTYSKCSFDNQCYWEMMDLWTETVSRQWNGNFPVFSA